MRIDLTTRYLGMHLENPLVPSAPALTSNLDGLKSLADAGAGAVVLAPLLEEKADPSFRKHAEEGGLSAQDCLELVEAARRVLPIPVIASLDGGSDGEWVKLAARMERAGASALELNLYHMPTDPGQTAAQVEDRLLELVADVREQVRIPLAVKLAPQLTAPANFVRRLGIIGVEAVVLFNRFQLADVNLESLKVEPRLDFSRSSDLLLPLTWIGVLNGQVDLELALSGGVHTHEDVVKAVLAGASVVELGSELMRHGPGRLTELLRELSGWMKERDYPSLEELRGRSSQSGTELRAKLRA